MMLRNCFCLDSVVINKLISFIYPSVSNPFCRSFVVAFGQDSMNFVTTKDDEYRDFNKNFLELVILKRDDFRMVHENGTGFRFSGEWISFFFSRRCGKYKFHDGKTQNETKQYRSCFDIVINISRSTFGFLLRYFVDRTWDFLLIPTIIEIKIIIFHRVTPLQKKKKPKNNNFALNQVSDE